MRSASTRWERRSPTRRRGRQRPAVGVRPELRARRAAGNRRRRRHDQQWHDHPRRAALHLPGPAGRRHGRAGAADAIPAEHEPVRLRRALQAGQVRRRVGLLLPALQRQDPVHRLRQRPGDHRQSVRTRLFPAIRQGPRPVRRVGQRPPRRLGGGRRALVPAARRRGHRPHGAAGGPVLRVLRCRARIRATSTRRNGRRT